MSKLIKGILFLALLLSQWSSRANDLDPRQIGKWPDYVRGPTRDFCVEGNFAYLAMAYNGVMILDVSDPTQPTRAGWFETPGICYDTAAIGDALYVADAKRGIPDLDPMTGLMVVDVRDKSAPRVVRTIASTDAKTVLCAGDRLIAVGSKVEIFDIREPLNPQLIGECPFQATGIWRDVRLALQGNTLFAANDEAGWAIVDIADPRNPRVLATQPTAGRASSIAAFGNYAYVTMGNFGSQIFDVTN